MVFNFPFKDTSMLKIEFAGDKFSPVRLSPPCVSVGIIKNSVAIAAMVRFFIWVWLKDINVDIISFSYELHTRNVLGIYLATVIIFLMHFSGFMYITNMFICLCGIAILLPPL